MNPSSRLLCSCCTIALLGLVLAACKKNDPAAQKVVDENITHRTSVDSSFRYESDSPFNRDSTIHFTGIKWFPPDARFSFTSRLYRFAQPETVIVLGTKGEERKQLKYGYFTLVYEGKEYRLNVYKFTPSDPARYAAYRNHLSVWFTDETTGKETYHVGRYVEVGEEQTDPNALYAIDLNKAYNPYCAYSALYSCAIPTKDDHLAFAVRAGEKKYHN